MLKTITRAILLTLTVLALIFPAQAQEETILVPFADDAYLITGLIPDGWEALGQGLYVPDRTGVTLLALQSAPATAEQVLAALQPQLGLSETPESIGTTETDAFTWTIYQVDVEVSADVTIRVDLALTEGQDRAYIVLMQANADQYEALHEAVFVPVVKAFAPLEIEPEDVPYQVEEVRFDNGILSLAGTLTLPEGDGPFPAVVLMTGSGQQTRDEEVVPGFLIFKLLADHLTRQGIAVLRYDDRGAGLSEGDYNAASVQDLASDGQAAVNFLREYADINPEQVGVLGHSEGGIYAAIMGANPDSGVAFIITLAGPGAKGTDLLLRQNELILETSGASEEVIASQLAFLEQAFPLIAARDWDAMEQLTYESVYAQWALAPTEQVEAMTEEDREKFARQSAANFRQGYAAEWFASLLDYDPAPDWAKTTVPVLALFGGLDVQVDAEQNGTAMEAALTAGGNPDFTVTTFPQANHLFQSAVTGGLDEYGMLNREFVPELLPALSDWLLAHVTVD